MASKVHEVEITSWKMFAEYCFLMGSAAAPMKFAYLTRGQARADWSLEPALSRRAKRAGLTPEKTLEIESLAVKEFQKEAHLYLPFTRKFRLRDHVSWWITMQHYGAPTRLLDWTASPFVAMYFAVVAEPDSGGAVWFFHGNPVERFMKCK